MVRFRTAVSVGVAAAAFALGGCVGYDGGSDDASLAAQSLGLTAKEEESIRGALAQKALTADEIAKLEKDLDAESGLPREWKAQTSLTTAASAFKSQQDYAACATDLNCRSLHCSQANICYPTSLFAADGSTVSHPFECSSGRAAPVSEQVCKAWSRRWYCPWCERRCDAWESVTKLRCASPLGTDSDDLKNANETDRDCGGESIYRCPIGFACSNTSDCAVGVCDSSTRTCVAGGGGLVDVGRFWTSSTGSDATRPYGTYVNLSAELPASEQIAAVRRTVMPDARGALVAAESVMSYQHDTCVKHLLANGCSPIAVEMRIHREAYQTIICDHSKSRAIGILARQSVADNRYLIASESKLGTAALTDDPYLCNHYFTRAASAIGHRQRDWDLWDITDTRPAPFGGKWSGIALTTNQSLYDGSRCPPPNQGRLCANETKANESLVWVRQIERSLLAGAACSVGRVVVGSTRSSAPRAPAGFDIGGFCARYAGQEPARENSGGGVLPRAVAGPNVDLTAAEWEFIRMNVPWWNDYDIYSIDPEGNPYAPVNMNMQYGWDAMHPGMNFGAYAASFGTTLVPTSTTYTFNGSAATVWGTSRTTTFRWNVPR